jgi:deleted-in-malignant-brain-tumors protein 1
MKGLLLFVAIVSCAYIQLVNGQVNGAVRLMHSPNDDNNQGRVQVFINTQWKEVCYEQDHSAEVATAVCRQLGFANGVYNAEFGGPKTPSSRFISNVRCDPNDQVLLQCTYHEVAVDCLSDLLFGVECTGRAWDDPFNGMIRLQDSNQYSNEGFIQIYCNGQWGTICLDFDNSSTTASSICYQLGYNTVDIVFDTINE